MIERMSLPSTTSARPDWSRSSTETARSSTLGTGGWCIARIVPCGAGMESSSASQSSCAGATSPWWCPGTVESSVMTRRPLTSSTRSTGRYPPSGSPSRPRRNAGAVVVVAHDPDDLRAEAVGHGVDDAADAVVRVGLAPVGEVAGEHDRLGPATGCLELVEQRAQVLLARDAVVELAAAGEQVRVADVEEEVIRPGILGRSNGHWGSHRSVATRDGGRRAHASRPRESERRMNPECDEAEYRGAEPRHAHDGSVRIERCNAVRTLVVRRASVPSWSGCHDRMESRRQGLVLRLVGLVRLPGRDGSVGFLGLRRLDRVGGRLVGVFDHRHVGIFLRRPAPAWRAPGSRATTLDRDSAGSARTCSPNPGRRTSAAASRRRSRPRRRARERRRTR